jgi:Cell division protein CrgA
VPKSKVRKKSVYTPPESVLQSRAAVRAVRPSPRWYAPLMVTLMVLGLAWIVVYYVAPDIGFISSIGVWNFAIGFGAMVVGLIMSMRWR